MATWYNEDLAFIHDAGFGDYALNCAPGIVSTLQENHIRAGLVVDLGCGSGLLARELVRAGYQVLGIDISEEMVRIAKIRAPQAEFWVRSLFETELPSCQAATSIGECFNYLFDRENSPAILQGLFQRVYDALQPEGIFLFDNAEPGQTPPNQSVKGFTEGPDWLVLFEKREQPETALLTRRITTFRKVGEHYRRSDEMHEQRLYRTPDIADTLRRVGFRVHVCRKLGSYEAPAQHAFFVARKPGKDQGPESRVQGSGSGV
ncbi:MAG: class I SAM-dependent methyltransferase [Blastocatellia bacterium]|nr:class I SAM-dependent methyltransferase [Blastocatellia bacterium]